MEEVGGIFGLVNFLALGGLAHGLSRELVGLQFEGQRVLLCDARKNDAHHVGNRQAHLLEYGGGLLFYFGVDSGTDNGVRGHARIVAHLSHKCAVLSQALRLFFDLEGGRRVLAGDYLSTGLAFKFEPGAMGDSAAGLCGLLIGGQAHCRVRLRDLARGKFGQGGKDEFGLAHVIAKILAF